MGCLENTLQGNDRSGTVDVNVNLAKAVEMTFSAAGTWPVASVSAPTPATPQLRELGGVPPRIRGPAQGPARTHAGNLRLLRLAARRYQPTPYLSALVGGCAESGRDITNGGARYNFITVEGIALGTAADSLAAVKRLVYEEGRVKMADLADALAKDYEGYETLRQTMLNRAPKYGNDDDYADDVPAGFPYLDHDVLGPRHPGHPP